MHRGKPQDEEKLEQLRAYRARRKEKPLRITA